MAEEEGLIIGEGDLDSFLQPSKGADDDDGSIEESSIKMDGDRKSEAAGFGDSFSSIKDMLSVGSIQEDLALHDDQNAIFTKAEPSENDPENVQALIDSYFAKLEQKRDSTGKVDDGALAAAAAAATAAVDVSEEDVKQIDDLNQVESYFNRIDSRNKLSGGGRRKVRSRRKKKTSENNDDLMDKFLAMSVQKKDSSRSMTRSGSSNQKFGL